METRIELPLIPTPKEATGGEDGRLKEGVFPAELSCTEGDFLAYAAAFAEDAARMHAVTFSAGERGIRVVRGPARKGGYRLEIGRGVTLAAADGEGLCAGFASLLQLMRKEGDGFALPKVMIDDYPETDYRCFMIDVARQWHPFETLLRFVDVCRFYKINKLQLHFMDDQSYTLPSRAFPKLDAAGRFYTEEQIAALNAYAAARGVTLIPEFEVPGHSRALIAAYPEVFGNAPGAAEGNAEGDNIICAGKEGVFEALSTLIGEVCTLFPASPYIHLGGDEARREIWGKCPVCGKFCAEHNIAGSKGLWSYAVKRATDMVLALGRTPVVWEGFPAEGQEEISREVIVVGWESYYRLAPDLLASGFRVVNGSWQPNYIVPSIQWSYPEILGWNIYNWQHFAPMSPAHLNPIHVPPTDRVLGGMMCCWEWNYAGEIPYVRRNLAAFSERTWSVRRVLETEEFEKKLMAVLPVIERVTPVREK